MSLLKNFSVDSSMQSDGQTMIDSSKSVLASNPKLPPTKVSNNRLEPAGMKPTTKACKKYSRESSKQIRAVQNSWKSAAKTL